MFSRSTGRGVFMLLFPLLILSSTYSEISLSGTLTDNVYLDTLRSAGNITSLSAFAGYRNDFEILWNARMTAFNFDLYDLFMSSNLTLQKESNFRHVGEKNILYTGGEVFYTEAYEEYRNISVRAGDSISVYMGNVNLGSDISISYNIFNTDIISNYLKPEINLGFSIPGPYLYIVPSFKLGAKFFGDSNLAFYRGGLGLDFPLTVEWGVSISGHYRDVFKYPEGKMDTDSLIRSPFFESEAIESITGLDLSVRKFLRGNKSWISLTTSLYSREFQKGINMDRNDRGIRGKLSYTGLIDRNQAVTLSLYSSYNFSNLEDFEYYKNDININLRFMF